MGLIFWKILEGGPLASLKVEVVGRSSKKASADFSLSSVLLPCVFFANRGSGLRHAFFVSVILPVTCDGLDPLLMNPEQPILQNELHDCSFPLCSNFCCNLDVSINRRIVAPSNESFFLLC